MKRYFVCQTTIDGTDFHRTHGSYSNWFSAIWKFLKLSFTAPPVGKTRYYIETKEVDDG